MAVIEVYLLPSSKVINYQVSLLLLSCADHGSRSILLPSDIEAMHPRAVDSSEQSQLDLRRSRTNGTNTNAPGEAITGGVHGDGLGRIRSRRSSVVLNGSTDARRVYSNLSIGQSPEDSGTISKQSATDPPVDNPKSAPALNRFLSTVYSNNTPADSPALSAASHLERISTRGSSEESSGKKEANSTSS